MIRTRFAPSPTGFLHIGSLRTALYAYALAKHSQGEFILRIEDTDQKREVAGSTEALQNTLQKFNIVWDEYCVQSQRHQTGIYLKAAEKLISQGNAFYCQCAPKNSKETGYSLDLRDKCRDKSLTTGAIKLKVPSGHSVSYYDFVHRKEITWDTESVYDATLLKSDGFPTYHLAAMVDDLDMNVTHILRGHDWLPSTPIHLLVFEFLGKARPEIGHLSDILSVVTGKKLSKRRDSVFCEQFLEEGYLSEALLNFVMLLGWAPKDNRELFTLQEFIESFDINGFQEANPKFTYEKLNWFNGHYLRLKSNSQLATLIKPFVPDQTLSLDVDINKVIPLIKDRIARLSDYPLLAGFLYSRPTPDPGLFTPNALHHLQLAKNMIESIELNVSTLNQEFQTIIEKNQFKTGNFFMDLRISIAGSKFTPPITESMVILGKSESLIRINSAIQLLDK